MRVGTGARGDAEARSKAPGMEGRRERPDNLPSASVETGFCPQFSAGSEAPREFLAGG
jgi:hypothetical protein